MATAKFEVRASVARRDLAALGVEFTRDGDMVTVFFPEVRDEDALFLIVKGVTGHGMVAALDNGRKEEMVTASSIIAKESPKAKAAVVRKVSGDGSIVVKEAK